MMTAVNLRVEPIQIDCKDLRVERQKQNNDTMLKLLQSGDITLVKRHCNIKEFSRLLEDLQIDEEQLLLKCKDDLLFAKVISRQISKMASRQGTKDEAFILQNVMKLRVKLVFMLKTYLQLLLDQQKMVAS